MRAALTVAVAALAAAVLLLDLSLTAVRVTIRRRQRQDRVLRPRSSRAVARYVTEPGEPPAPGSPAERVIFRDVALQALSDLRGSERDTLVGLMGQLGYAGEAARALTARRRAARRRAAEELALTATPADGQVLARGLSDRDPLVRTSCARTLARVGGPAEAGLAAAVAARDMAAVPGAAAAVLLALGRNHPATLGGLLRPATPDAVRTAAVTVAGRLRLAELAPGLRACLPAGDTLAAAAARGLGLIGDSDSAGDLRAIAADAGRAAPVRAAAAGALGSIGVAASVPVLEPLLLASAFELRAAAAQALAWLGEPGAAALRRAVQWGPPEARAQAEAVLAP